LNGTAILGGWILAMAADFRVLSNDGKIALSEIRFGLSPTSLLISRLTQISAAPSLVKDLVLKGKTLRADEALSGGFVDALAEPEAVVAEALAVAKNLAKQSPLGYASVKKALWPDDPKLWDAAMAEFQALFADPQTREGIEAMRDKRRPKWEN
jgi:enoyl-CoA hydratase/carnithine racemase